MKRIGTVLLLLLIALPIFAQRGPKGEELTRAEYGWGSSWVDVTERVRSLIRGHSLQFRADNQTLGVDPRRGKDKALRVYLRNEQGGTRRVTFQENEYVQLQPVYSGTGRGHGRGAGNRYGGLQILRATYGYGNRSIDVTDRLRQQVQNGQINLQVTNDTMGGDPAVGQAKTLTVQSSLNGRTNQTVVNEGDYLRLSGGDNNYQDGYQGSLQILRGTYGYGNRSIDVTSRLRQQAQNGQINLQVTNDTMGGDPAVNRPKTLTVQSTYNGRTSQTVVNEGDYLRLPDSSLQGSNGGYGGAYTIIPSGTQLTIRTNEAIDSKTASVGQTFSASMAEDVINNGGAQTIRKGSDVSLVIRSTSGSDLVLDIDSLTVDGNRYYVSTQDLNRKGSGGIGANQRTAVMVGGGAAVGAIIGAIVGGGKGAAIGAGIGAAGGALGEVVTGGKEVRVPAETVLSFKLDQDVRLQR